MKHISVPLVLLSMLLTLPFVCADVAVVVEFPDGCVRTDCVSISDGSSGYSVIQRSDFDALWSDEGPWGRGLCKINDIGTEKQGANCEWTSYYWAFSLALDGDGSWTMHSPVGHTAGDCWDRDPASFEGHYCAQDGDVLGYEFTNEFPSGYPRFVSFDQICGSDEPPTFNCPGSASGSDNRKVQIESVEPDPLEIRAGESAKLEVIVKNIGKEDEVVTLDADLPGGWGFTPSTFDLTKREGDITVNPVVSVPWDQKPDKFVVRLIADYVYGTATKLMIVDVLPPKPEVYRKMRALSQLAEAEALQSEKENATNGTEGESELNTIRYEPPVVMNRERQTVHLVLYYMEDGSKVLLAHQEVLIDGEHAMTDGNGKLKLPIKLRSATLLEVEKEGFEDFKVEFRPRVVLSGIAL